MIVGAGTAVLILSCGATPVGSGKPAGDAQQSDPVEEKLRELERKLAEREVEIVRLRLELAKARSDEKQHLSILEQGLSSDIPLVREFVLRQLLAQPRKTAERFLPKVRGIAEGNGDPGVRVRAVEFMSRFEEGEEVLLRIVLDASPEVRAAAAAGLKNFPGDRSFSALRVLLKDPETPVRIAAVEAIGRTKHPEAGRVILSALGEDSPPELLDRGLRMLGTLKVKEAFDLFVKSLSHKDESVRWAAVYGLGLLGDPRALSHVRPFLDSESEGLREVAIETLGRLGDRGSLPGLEEILRQSPKAFLRAAAATAMGRIGALASLEPLLDAFAKDKESSVRIAAWDAAVSIAGKEFDREEKLFRLLLARKHKGEAESIFQKMSELHQREAERKRLGKLEDALARFLVEEGDFARAIEHLKRITAAGGTLEHVELLSRCYRKVGDTDSALKVVEAALAGAKPGQKGYVDLLLELCRVRGARKEDAQVLDTAERILGTKPELVDGVVGDAYEEVRRAARRLHGVVRTGKEPAAGTAGGLLKKHARLVMEAACARGPADFDLQARIAWIEIANLVTGSRDSTDAAQKDESFAKVVSGWKAWLAAHPR